MITFVGTVASTALVALATTGAPGELKRELGGQIVKSSEISAAAVLNADEHLAPKALKLADGTLIAMVAPTITKDNFVVVVPGKKAVRLDSAQGEDEGGKIFVVTDPNTVADGGVGFFTNLWHGILGIFD